MPTGSVRSTKGYFELTFGVAVGVWRLLIAQRRCQGGGCRGVGRLTGNRGDAGGGRPGGRQGWRSRGVRWRRNLRWQNDRDSFGRWRIRVELVIGVDVGERNKGDHNPHADQDDHGQHVPQAVIGSAIGSAFFPCHTEFFPFTTHFQGSRISISLCSRCSVSQSSTALCCRKFRASGLSGRMPLSSTSTM